MNCNTETVNSVARQLAEMFKTAVTEQKTMGKFVEPVHLQIVCQSLWESLPLGGQSIRRRDVQAFGNVDQALVGFYEDVLEQVSQQTGLNQRRLRAWFDEYLIIPAQTQGLVFRGDQETAGLPNEVVDQLNNSYLIRAEIRRGATWYELAHDRLVEPVRTVTQPGTRSI